MAIAYGFVGIQHLFNTRVSQAGQERIWTAVTESAAEHSRVMTAALAALVEPTEIAQEQYELGNSGILQPLDDKGNPRPVKPTGSYQVGYPIFGGGTAWGDNRVSRAHMTVEEANRNTVEAQNADANWLLYHMLAALLDNTSYTYNDKAYGSYKGLGDITVQPLANGDAVTYTRIGGTISTDNHYYAQAAAIADGANPYPTLYDDLVEHPSNSGPYVAYIATSLKTTTRALTNFVEVDDPDIQRGSGNDVIVAQLDRGFGDRVLGKTDDLWIVEWSRLPAGYGLVLAQGAAAPLKWREYVPASLKGLFPESHSPDGNLQESRLIRYGGAGGSNRVGAMVFQIGNGTYQIPTGYNTPLQTN